ncbi:unnamed protein product [Pedinophyceae sp. YPF-701]|nr:unnamed protein product [Pedinophyceae sp. YPF-701]
MKLDAEALRHLSNEHFRVLTAIEMGQRNHEIVPLPLIDQIAGLRRGGTHKLLRDLGRHKLVHHDGTKYDGYRLTYQGYDFLAIKTLVRRGVLTAVGRLLGVGKESDIFEALGADGEVVVLKLHRLGRTSFRSVRKNRDYLRRGSHFSWLYLSRLAAIKEAAFMRALGDRGFPVPDAIDQNRHAVVMSHVEGYPLVQVREVRHPAQVFNELMAILCRMAAVGLVHCDYNEFNVLVSREDDAITVIDFPQMVSVTHRNAKELFDRDVECIIRFFRRKVGWDPESDPDVKVLRPDLADYAATEHSVDRELHASGFKTKHQEALEAYEWRRGSDDEGGSGDDESGDEGEGESEGEE